MKKIRDFTLHNERGEAVLEKDILKWFEKNSRVFGRTWVSWFVGEKEFCLPAENCSIRSLPDDSGLICFKSGFTADNCCILDIEGKLRYRLRVPWELTGKAGVPNDTEMWFIGLESSPEDGEYGVAAHIEGAGVKFGGDYYFELDYHTGQFLWGREIRY